MCLTVLMKEEWQTCLSMSNGGVAYVSVSSSEGGVAYVSIRPNEGYIGGMAYVPVRPNEGFMFLSVVMN